MRDVQSFGRKFFRWSATEVKVRAAAITMSAPPTPYVAFSRDGPLGFRTVVTPVGGLPAGTCDKSVPGGSSRAMLGVCCKLSRKHGLYLAVNSLESKSRREFGDDGRLTGLEANI